MIGKLKGTVDSFGTDFLILDVHGLKMHDPVALESELNQIAGVVCNGLFARRPADIALVASAGGVRTLAG